MNPILGICISSLRFTIKSVFFCFLTSLVRTQHTHTHTSFRLVIRFRSTCTHTPHQSKIEQIDIEIILIFNFLSIKFAQSIYVFCVCIYSSFDFQEIGFPIHLIFRIIYLCVIKFMHLIDINWIQTLQLNQRH